MSSTKNTQSKTQLQLLHPTLTRSIGPLFNHSPNSFSFFPQPPATMADAADAAAKQPLKKKQASTANKAYLIFYNFVSAVQWSVVLGRTVLLLGLYGPEYVYPNAGQYTKWTQTLAGLEVLHSLLGMISLFS